MHISLRICTTEQKLLAVCLNRHFIYYFATSTGFHKDFFRQNYISNPFTEMGMFHYPPYENSEDTENTEWAIGPHTDYGCLTLLSQCENGGLQVRIDLIIIIIIIITIIIKQ